jgi:hypothetical protein
MNNNFFLLLCCTLSTAPCYSMDTSRPQLYYHPTITTDPSFMLRESGITKTRKNPIFPVFVVPKKGTKKHPGSTLLKKISTNVLRRQKERDEAMSKNIEVLRKEIEKEESCNRNLLKELEKQKELNDLKRLQNNYLDFGQLIRLVPAIDPRIQTRFFNQSPAFSTQYLTNKWIVQHHRSHNFPEQKLMPSDKDELAAIHDRRVRERQLI